MVAQLSVMSKAYGMSLPQRLIELPVTADVVQLRDDMRDTWLAKQTRAKREVQTVRMLSRQ